MLVLIKMIITINNEKIDTDKDLTSPERHILQKLFLWEPIVSSLREFREKRDQALKAGWNNSGPIIPSRTIMLIIKELESRIIKRLHNK